jgi:hypothetical protein
MDQILPTSSGLPRAEEYDFCEHQRKLYGIHTAKAFQRSRPTHLTERLVDLRTLQPGDRVIDLTSVARLSGVISGLVTGGLVTWLATGEMGWTLALGVIGGIAGWIAGRLLGRVRYMTDGRRMVVKYGPSARQATTTAALSASLPVAILVWLGCLTILGGPAPSLATGAACLLTGIVTGVLLGSAASRM